MTNKNKVELQVRNREIQSRMSELNEKIYNEKREFTAEEKAEWDALTREKLLNQSELKDMLNDAELAQVRENANRGAQLRELLRDASKTGQKREITLYTVSGETSDITTSGAIELNIHDILPTLNEGLGLPPTLSVVTGVTGNEVWPVSTSDVEMEEVGEVAELSDQVLNFANISATATRVGLKVPVSNMAIDNAAFDLMAFVQQKFTVAMKKYLACKLYSQAAYTGNHGPFSGLTATGAISYTTAYASILAAVADFVDNGFNADNVCLIMDAVTEATLKATPKVDGVGMGFVIENGLCAGYPYVVSHYINTELNSDSELVATSTTSIGIGFFDWFALQQHGDVRLVVDPITQADKNVTRVILNTAWSMTDLSIYLNGAAGTTQAFALYTIS